MANWWSHATQHDGVAATHSRSLPGRSLRVSCCSRFMQRLRVSGWNEGIGRSVLTGTKEPYMASAYPGRQPPVVRYVIGGFHASLCVGAFQLPGLSRGPRDHVLVRAREERSTSLRPWNPAKDESGSGACHIIVTREHCFTFHALATVRGHACA